MSIGSMAAPGTDLVAGVDRPRAVDAVDRTSDHAAAEIVLARHDLRLGRLDLRLDDVAVQDGAVELDLGDPALRGAGRIPRHLRLGVPEPRLEFRELRLRRLEVRAVDRVLDAQDDVALLHAHALVAVRLEERARHAGRQAHRLRRLDAPDEHVPVGLRHPLRLRDRHDLRRPRLRHNRNGRHQHQKSFHRCLNLLLFHSQPPDKLYHYSNRREASETKRLVSFASKTTRFAFSSPAFAPPSQ